MKLKENKEKDENDILKSFLKRNQRKKCLLTLDFKPFNSEIKGKHSERKEFHSLAV